MIMEELDHLFRTLDVRGASSEKFLESDLGLDLLGRQCIREDIEERLHLVISDDEIRFDLTMLELAGLLSRKKLVTPERQNFDGKLIEDIVIPVPEATVAAALRDVAAWPHRLPQVRDIRLIYNDWIYQEFVLELAAGNAEPRRVRIVQRCESGHIAYFHPEPACFLKHYCGDWLVRPLGESATHLTLAQRWTVSAKAEILFPACDSMSSAEQITALLREEARNSLAAWKDSLERGIP
jgi:hypothetical protein